MSLLLEGIQLGLLLAMLTGPLFFALIQAGLEQGLRLGIVLGLGIWISDLLFIFGVYWGFSYVSRLADWPAFAPVAGSIGALVLVGYGVYALVTPPALFPEGEITSRQQWKALWLKGFLINTVNPFTVFFWTSTMTGVVLDRHLDVGAAALFFGGILGVIIITDTAKIALARHLRQWMKPHHFFWLRRIAGAAFVVFGLVLAWRAWQ